MANETKIPISDEKVLKLLRYSFSEPKTYDELTAKEREIISPQDFVKIKEVIQQ